MELRMYGLVNYQLTGIQKGIQYGHALQEYNNIIMDWMDENPEVGSEKYNKIKLFREWAKNYKTFIVLNGGTTNKNLAPLNKLNEGIYRGTLNNYKVQLESNGIDVIGFEEYDLGDQLTAIVFLVDERIFLKENGKYVYLDFEDWIFDNPSPYITFDRLDKHFIKSVREKFKNSDNKDMLDYYNRWVDHMGGVKNVFLRDFTRNLKLA
jgi:hypothetical protein